MIPPTNARLNPQSGRVQPAFENRSFSWRFFSFAAGDGWRDAYSAGFDAIFSVGRKCGSAADITKWGQVGMTGEWANRDVAMYSRNSVSGTYGYFKDVALCKGDFKRNVAEQPGSASVVQSVATQINAIGYSGIGYKTSGVRALPLSKKPGQPFVEADGVHALDGTYPLARVLYVYVNKKPNQPLLEREFFKMVLSQQGQKVVIKDGFVPMPARMAAQAAETLTK